MKVLFIADAHQRFVPAQYLHRPAAAVRGPRAFCPYRIPHGGAGDRRPPQGRLRHSAGENTADLRCRFTEKGDRHHGHHAEYQTGAETILRR